MIKQVAKRIYSFFEILRIKKHSKISFKSIFLGKNKLEGKNVINKNNYIKNCSFGYGSFVGENNFFVDVCVGRFSSIGSNVKVVSSIHPSSVFVSTHPAFIGKVMAFLKTLAPNSTNRLDVIMRYAFSLVMMFG